MLQKQFMEKAQCVLILFFCKLSGVPVYILNIYVFTDVRVCVYVHTSDFSTSKVLQIII